MKNEGVILMGRVLDKTFTTASIEHYTRHTAMLNQPLTLFKFKVPISWPGAVVQSVKTLFCKPENLRLIFSTHMRADHNSQLGRQ